jgi:hypothetical protein
LFITTYSNSAASSNSPLLDDATKISAELQQIVVSGTVTDAETSEGLPGVTVVVKGTTIGTITGIDGGYTITVTNPN